MKGREPRQGGGASAEMRRTKNRQRLGGKGVGLSLMAFSNAKSKDTGYNPAIIKKQREFYKNAKIVNKYKKTVKQNNESEEKLLPGLLCHEREQNADESGKNGAMPASREQKNKKRTKKKDVRLQSLREEYEKKQEEKEREREEREAAVQAKKEERARAEAARKTLKQKMFKRTSSGQPVMRYRIEHILQGLQNELL